MKIEKILKKLDKHRGKSAETSELSTSWSLKACEETYIDFSESKITTLEEIIEQELSKETLESILESIYLFKSPEIFGLRTGMDIDYKNNIIYKITGEIGEKLHISYHNGDFHYVTEKPKRINSKAELKASLGRSLHTNDMGKTMKEVKKL